MIHIRSLPLLLSLMAILAGADFLILIIVLGMKNGKRRFFQRQRTLWQQFHRGVHAIPWHRYSTAQLLAFLENLDNRVIIEREQLTEPLGLLEKRKIPRRYRRRLRSAQPEKRVQAARVLRWFPDETTTTALRAQIKKEKLPLVRVLIFSDLCRRDPETRREALRRVIQNPHDKGEILYSLLSQLDLPLQEAILNDLEEMLPHASPACRQMAENLIVRNAERVITLENRLRLMDHAENGDSVHARLACQGLLHQFPEFLQNDRYLKHADPLIRLTALKSLREAEPDIHFRMLTAELEGTEYPLPVINELHRLLEQHSTLRRDAVKLYLKQKEGPLRLRLALLLEKQIPPARLAKASAHKLLDFLIPDLAAQERTAWLLDLRHNPSTEPSLVSRVTEFLEDSERKESQRQHTGSSRIEKAVTFLFLPLLIGAVALLYQATALRRGVVPFLLWYNYMFVYYSLIVNSSYFVLLLLSLKELTRQIRLDRINLRDLTILNGVLPRISVLAPAWNEESTINDSVLSLLNLNYPHHEVIVINDGSRDGTMARLKERFELRREQRSTQEEINTQPIRNIYRSTIYPNLRVIDKYNGGKADSLNAGINYAKGEYICCIDADSLLEPRSLQLMVQPLLFSRREVLAVGGNILPVNGCRIRRGALQKIALSKRLIPRLQTLEYMRAFLAGRLGWSALGPLLIISGAFGLFKRSRVLEAGGYLTEKGPFHRDTVGEDMELVVRLVRRACERRRSWRVLYAHSANCWTQVPEDAGSLIKQRSRWHKGLLEVLTFHRRMFGSPRYGTAGMIAFPYFLLIEILGPFLEASGLLILILSAILGVLSPTTALAFFIASIELGTIVSLTSLAISENQVVYYSPKETIRLFLLGIFENFGYRQLMSFLRVTAWFGYHFNRSGWGRIKRRSFADEHKTETTAGGSGTSGSLPGGG